MKADYLLLSPDSPAEISRYLQSMLESGETVQRVEKAGEGNMNLTLRVQTNRRSFIVKQSRPWVEKYPQIAAPEARVLVEGTFYRTVANLPEVAEKMPMFISLDEKNRVMILEDLGPAADLTSLYHQPSTWAEYLPALCHWLRNLHSMSFPAEIRQQLTNRDMRTLNHEHLYHFPLLKNNGMALDDITPGLQAAGDRLKNNPAYVNAIKGLGKLYLTDGETLLHGDYFPGSWLRFGDDVRIIDPEFTFFGPGEYDLGVMMAHFLMSGNKADGLDKILQLYQPDKNFKRALAMQFCGMEIMRRLIGVAQLPLSADVKQKAALLSLSEKFVLEADRF